MQGEPNSSTCRKWRPGRHLSKARKRVLAPPLWATRAANLVCMWALNQKLGCSAVIRSLAGGLPRLPSFTCKKATAQPA